MSVTTTKTARILRCQKERLPVVRQWMGLKQTAGFWRYHGLVVCIIVTISPHERVVRSILNEIEDNRREKCVRRSHNLSIVPFSLRYSVTERPLPVQISHSKTPLSLAGWPVFCSDGVLARDDCYKFDYSGLFERRQNGCKLLILLVGERGFEPPTPWSRTRCSTRLSHSPNMG